MFKQRKSRVGALVATMVMFGGLAVLAAPVVTDGAAGARSAVPRAVNVNIMGGDHFIHPGLLTNDFRFPDDPIVVAQGGTITFHNMTAEGHTIVLVRLADVPTTTAQVDHCPFCDAVNGVFFPNPNSQLPAGAQLDNGVVNDDSNADADAPDTGAINSVGGHLPPGLTPLIEDFDTPGHGTTVGDATIIGTGPGNGPNQRTIVMTAPPGLYHYMCTFHAWMQGTIRVVKAN